MADTIASVGLAVESADAEAKLRNFAAIARRTGETVDQVAERFKRLNEGAKGVQNPLQQASASARRHAEQMERMAVSTQKAGAAATMLTSTLRSMVAALAGGAIYKALELSIGGLASLADKMQDTRLSKDVLQGLRIGAAEARVSQNEMNRAIERFTEVSKQAEPEAKGLLRALAAIGPAFAEAFKTQAGKPGGQDERLRIIADAMAAARTETQRFQLAQKAFGTDNERLINMWVKGRSALSDYIEEARRFGILIDTAFISKAQEAERTLGVLSTVIADKLRVAIVDLIPTIQNALPYFERIAKAVRDYFFSFAMPEERPTEMLTDELSGMLDKIETLQRKRSDIIAQNQAFGSSTSFMWGSPDSNLKAANQELDEAKAAYEETFARYKAIIEKRRANELLPKPGDANFIGPVLGQGIGFSGRDKFNQSGTPFDSAVNSINKHIAAMTADAMAVGKSTAEHARLRVENQLLEVAQRNGGKATAEQMEKIKALGQAAADAAQKLALTRLASDIKFDRSQIGLSDSEASANSRLRQIYGDDLTSAQAQFYKQQLMINDALREYSDIGKDATKGFISDIMAGKSAMESLSNALNKVANKLLDMAMNDLWGAAFGGGKGNSGLGIGGSLLSALFGGPSTVMVGNYAMPKFAHGGVFANDNIPAFAKGGTFTNSIVNSPTLFRFARGTGLMGEAGPEAIMPLKRAPDGSLGVAAQGGGQRGLVVNFHNAPAGTEAGQATLTDMPGGGMQLDVVFKPVVQGIFAEDMNTGGPMRKTMEAAMRGFNGR